MIEMRRSLARGACGGLVLIVALACVVPASAMSAVLYDQTTPMTGGAYGSNDFNPPNDSSDSQSADDFTVPPGQSWQISQVDVVGIPQSGSPPPTVNVFLYSTSGTIPGAELFHQSGITASNPYSYSIPVAGTPMLPPGTYWVSVQQAGASLPDAYWFWNASATQSGNPGVFRNPPGGSVPACTDWKTFSACFFSPAPDLLFKISGTAAPYPPPAPSNEFTVGKSKLNRAKGTAREPITVPGPGVLTLTGKGLVSQRPAGAVASRVIPAAGTVRLLIRAKGKAKHKLNATGKVSVRPTITFTPTGGTPNSHTKTIMLRKRLR